MPKKIPVGVDNFYKLVKGDYLFCDKTLMIPEFLDRGEEITLITRQRRSGKTLNMSMLQCFLAPQVYGHTTAGLFNGLNVATFDGGQLLAKHQGQYPVIFITLKDVKESTYELAIQKISRLIMGLCEEFEELANSPRLSASKKQRFNQLLQGTHDSVVLSESLYALSELLCKHTGKSVYILIDEYDTPLHAAYSHKYLDAMIDFMRNLFSSALKGNPYLAKGLMTGILRISKDSMLSGLNNLEVYTLLDEAYKDHFGFNEAEVTALFNAQGMATNLTEVKAWYNGYQSYDVTVYNPWSIMCCLNRGGSIEAYWVNVGKNNLVKEVIIQSGSGIKQQLETLMSGDTIKAEVDKHVTFETLIENPASVWSLLLFAGYLKSIKAEYNPENGKYTCQLAIPNKEVRSLYSGYIGEWLCLTRSEYQAFIMQLLEGNAEEFTEKLGAYLLQSASFFDVGPDKKSEQFYHGFVLALLASISNTHHVRSNRESGLGRYDVLICPKDASKTLAVILEFKRAKKTEDSEQLASAALQQIDENLYDAELKGHAFVSQVLKIGLAFSEKSVVSSYEITDLISHEVKRGTKRKTSFDDPMLVGNGEEAAEYKSNLPFIHPLPASTSLGYGSSFAAEHLLSTTAPAADQEPALRRQ